MSAERKRQCLDEFCSRTISAEDLAESYPDCSCEAALSPPGSPGPVQNEERLRYFLMSTSDVDGKSASQLRNRPFKAKSLKRAYTSGLSVCRLAHATPEELENTARELHATQSRDRGDFGGVVAVVDFPAGAVRFTQEGAFPFCVLETPLHLVAPTVFERPAHADVVNSKKGMTEEEQKSSREILFNQIQAQCTKTHAEDVKDCDLRPFLPAVLQQNL